MHFLLISRRSIHAFHGKSQFLGLQWESLQNRGPGEVYMSKRFRHIKPMFQLKILTLILVFCILCTAWLALILSIIYCLFANQSQVLYLHSRSNILLLWIFQNKLMIILHVYLFSTSTIEKDSNGKYLEIWNRVLAIE